ncbi:heparan-alpha-glucosaminide N-acetyltransferase-like isoform X2 [Actinia tenebrosa]|uniref:Heparan-alpha-glucosaminide N-acetyltransferase-like isoform X2 n=1 Tax=Actinia tenebrosa TaxID=6105 RepID=A0A6P8J019_ACTTE|nr:heparan-alpha-glucosaminide N-acetyltransferase-like isoform X2 [Actinia tenebrosa]
MAPFYASVLLGALFCASVSCQNNFDGKLKMDSAFVNIKANLNEPISVLGISSNCYKCPLQTLHSDVITSANITVPTHYDYILVISTRNDSRSCSLRYLYGEYGWYEYTVHRDNQGKISCELKVTKEPHNAYIPILVAFIVLAVLAVLWVIYSFNQEKCSAWCRRRFSSSSDENEAQREELPREAVVLHESGSVERNTTVHAVQIEPQPDKPTRKRLKSLDTFRGIAITVMIFVNFGGGGYYFFEHAVWNGLLLADVVFPWFIWIMGVSITLSFKSIRRKKMKSSRVLVKIIRRSIILFGLGVFTSNFNDLKTYRVPGVLQRFGACYFVVAVMQLYLPPREEQPKRWLVPFRDVVSLWKQWLVTSIILIIYLIVTYGLKVEGCPKGYTGPGGTGEGYPLSSHCTGGVANYIDREFLGRHIYQYPTVKHLYKTTIPHDPEGCLGTLTSIVLVFFGVQAGHILHTYPDHKSRIIRWTIWGILLGVIGIGLCGGTQDGGPIPINKNLWSLSFILVTGATSFILLVICYVLTDTYGWWNGAPFFYPGMNSILLYVGHGILYNNFPFSWKIHNDETHAEKLSMNLIGTACWLLISFYLFQKKFFLKI